MEYILTAIKEIKKDRKEKNICELSVGDMFKLTTNVEDFCQDLYYDMNNEICDIEDEDEYIKKEDEQMSEIHMLFDQPTLVFEDDGAFSHIDIKFIRTKTGKTYSVEIDSDSLNYDANIIELVNIKTEKKKKTKKNGHQTKASGVV